MPPAEARRHFGVVGSTPSPAEDQRVGAHRVSEPDDGARHCPGQRVSTATADHVAARSSTSASATPGWPHTAISPDRGHGVRHRPCGLVGHHVSVRRRSGSRTGGRASSVANTSSTRPRRNAASTRLGPSARKRAAWRCPAGRCSLIAAATRLDFSREGCQAASPDGALTSSGRAALATSTSAVNAAGSLMAISRGSAVHLDAGRP